MTAFHALDVVRALAPRRLVIENVVHMRAWGRYGAFLEGLMAAGYRLRPQVLDAADFGVPQTRRRLFVLGDREAEPPDLTGVRAGRGTVWDILDPPDRHASRPLYREGRAAPTLARAERAMAALGRGVPFLVVYYGSDAAGGWQRLDRPLRTITTLDRFGLVTWEGREPMLRMLQVDELRRAMGFDPAFRLDRGTRRDRIRLLGNGVCPPVMAAVVRRLADRRPAASVPARRPAQQALPFAPDPKDAPLRPRHTGGSRQARPITNSW